MCDWLTEPMLHGHSGDCQEVQGQAFNNGCFEFFYILFDACIIDTFILGKGVGEKGLFREVAGDVVLVTGAGHGMGR